MASGNLFETTFALKQWAEWKAEEIEATFTGEPAHIQELVDNHEFVVAVWKDDEQEGGSDCLIIKGRARIFFGRFDPTRDGAAIPCASSAAAEAIQMCVKSGVRMG